MIDYENIKDIEVSSYEKLGSMNEDSVVATCNLSNVVSAICYDVSNMLDKREGGVITGDVAVFQHNMRVLSGNYIQTNDNSLCVQNFSYKNAFLQAELVADYADWGIACTGSRGYCILSVNHAENKIKLSGDDISELASHLNEKYSWAFGSAGDCQSLEISSVDSANSIITLKSTVPADLSGATSALTSEDEYVYHFEHDDNAFYCPAKPDIGNTIIHNFYANHAEGGSVKAIGKYTHAEGRATIADMRYSHAEGDRTIAGRMAAHAEGQGTKAYGHYSHAEGYYTKTDNNAKAAHAEGYLTYAKGAYSHAEGNQTSAIGVHSHAQGEKTKAQRDNTHAAGYMCEANAQNSTAIGRYSRVLSTDNNAFAWQGQHENAYYESKGIGTFNINPEGGACGFYIGADNLCSIISDEMNALSNEFASEIDSSLSSKLDLTGGVISGNLTVGSPEGTSATGVKLSEDGGTLIAFGINNGAIIFSGSSDHMEIVDGSGNMNTLQFPSTSGTLALTSQIPEVNPVAFTLKSFNAYDSNAEYHTGDVVAYNGALYVVKDEYYLTPSDLPDINHMAWSSKSLFDHAINAISIDNNLSLNLSLTMPASSQTDYARDLYVNLDVQNAAQNITLSANDENNNPITLLNSSNSFTLSQGHHVIHILEAAQSTFIVSELPMLQ